MGKVVSLEASAKGRRTATSSQGRRAPSRPRRAPSKTALVLGGGGFTGAVYEIGALRALDLLSVNRSVTDFDVYVGTSAGSFVAAMTANGVTPEEMMRVLDRQAPTPFPDIALGTLLSLNLRELATKAAAFPFRFAKLGYMLARHLGQVSALDVVLGIAEGLPSGLYSGKGSRTTSVACSTMPGAPTTFAGSSASSTSPRPTSTRASGSCSGPTRLRRRADLDGRARLDGAADGLRTGARRRPRAGRRRADLDDEPRPRRRGRRETRRDRQPARALRQRGTPREPAAAARVSEMGFAHIGYQAFKLMTYRRLHEIRTMWEARYPGVDFVLIEPDASDELMFRTGVMDYASRVQIASHGFRSVTAKLAEDYPRLKQVAARHGIEISATRVRKVVKHFAAEPEQTTRWRKILEQTTGALLRQSAAEQ